jgi:hypothetical protein
MAQYQVTAIRKPNIFSSHEHITHIGNPQAGWIMTREEAIRQIDGNLNSFYVVDPRNLHRIAWVGVVRERGKLSYLRTHADGVWNDNLLSLPQC